jgi:hypothetical protein
MSLLKEINRHIDNIIQRINNVYNLGKYEKLFNEYGNYKDIASLNDLLKKLNIYEELESNKQVKINEIYKNTDLKNLDLEKITNLSNIKLQNNLNDKNINSEGYERIIKIINERIKEINIVSDDLKKIRDRINLKINEMKIKSEINLKDTDIILKREKSEEKIVIDIEELFQIYNIGEIYKINEEMKNIKDEILENFDISNKNWFKKQKAGGNILEYNNINYKYLESITTLKEVFSDILLKYKEYNKLSAEFILYLLLILELYKIIENKPDKLNRYISKDEIIIYKSQIKNYKIFDNDIFMNRVNKLLNFIEKLLKEKNMKYIDLFESRNIIEIYILDMIMNKF